MEDKLKYIRSLFPKWERPTPIPCKFVTINYSILVHKMKP